MVLWCCGDDNDDDIIILVVDIMCRLLRIRPHDAMLVLFRMILNNGHWDTLGH